MSTPPTPDFDDVVGTAHGTGGVSRAGTADAHGTDSVRRTGPADAPGATPPAVTATPRPQSLSPGDPRGTRLDAWWARAVGTPTRWRLWYWGAPLAVTLLAAVLRLWDLGNPHALVFDETFYVKDSYTLLHFGYEASWPDKADTSFNAGNTDIFSSAPEFVAHPPFGKWIIALGLAVFGASDSVGWRISTALVGILAVLVVTLVARRLFRSTLVATIAGFLMAVDGHAIVMSRVALLDNSVMFLALLAFWAILADRTWFTRRLETRVAAARAAGRTVDWGPTLWWRPWLLAAALLLGLCSGVKWSGLYFLAFFAVYTVVVDAVARRRLGLPFFTSAAVLKQGPATFLIMVPLALVTYMSTWAGWLATSGGFYRHWAETEGTRWSGLLDWVPLWFQNLWHYQTAMYNYSINLHVPHPYQSNPFEWLLMLRPTSMYYLGTSAGQAGCTASDCSSAITGMGNPLIWWAGTACAVYLVYRLIRFREWQVGAILMGFGAGYLPWLLYINRTIFEFYTIAYEPYMVLGIAAVIALILGSRADARWRRQRGLWLVAVFLFFVTVVSAFFWPLWTGEQIPFWYWQLHIWIPGWR
ncbi:phospholipid carrier-dependent glycosyltransferase [Microbacterium sp. STN6]|uniref:dolichyl-phosphate-mannose--protein mannosyltransferase n=1 Tax=Microbacterium sp. STN6 TaxID=2995588 RepID=UPI0022608C5A|nr:phospholipid carrier-dependent glycosyltransferase [Microbacterium sp. STN6]MCX7521779.1 phospholipid carrier-dependent glycosyltransferase [Microbacterium sp. STN6]